MKRILKVRAGVRYYEDGTVNGKRDISYEEQKQGATPAMPCVVKSDEFDKDGWSWNLEIDAESGIVLNWQKGVKAVTDYKVCDECVIEYFEDDILKRTNDGYYYVPDFLCLDDEGFGDYMYLTIDENGQIANWNKEKLQAWIVEQGKRIIIP